MSPSISSSSSSSRLPSASPASPASQPTLPESFHHVKLLSALRSGPLSLLFPIPYSAAPINHYPTLGDPALIHPFLAGLGSHNHHDGGENGGENDIGAAALHLAVRCASGAPLCSLSWLPCLIRLQPKQSRFCSPTGPSRLMLSTPQHREQPLSI